MYSQIVTSKDEGQRLIKYLNKLLPGAGNSFLYKMLRKKNIVLNKKKTDGSDILRADDVIDIYFCDETLQKFMESKNSSDKSINGGNINKKQYFDAYNKIKASVIYENNDILLVNKPVGELSQKAAATDVSVNEWLIGYMLINNKLNKEDLRTFKPSVCNRLDRNTGGILLCAKTLKGAQYLSKIIKERQIKKYYICYVKGSIEKEDLIEGYLTKDEKTNKVTVSSIKSDESDYINTAYKPLEYIDNLTKLEVELITGKPHQIRAHLSSIGHPVVGDNKYGDLSLNRKLGLKHQFLYAYKVIFPVDNMYEDLNNKIFVIDVPKLKR